MAKKGDRAEVTLACPTCRQRNYTTYKNKRNDSERMELNKYCPKCRSHTAHRETR